MIKKSFLTFCEEFRSSLQNECIRLYAFYLQILIWVKTNRPTNDRFTWYMDALLIVHQCRHLEDVFEIVAPHIRYITLYTIYCWQLTMKISPLSTQLDSCLRVNSHSWHLRPFGYWRWCVLKFIIAINGTLNLRRCGIFDGWSDWI